MNKEIQEVEANESETDLIGHEKYIDLFYLLAIFKALFNNEQTIN